MGSQSTAERRTPTAPIPLLLQPIPARHKGASTLPLDPSCVLACLYALPWTHSHPFTPSAPELEPGHSHLNPTALSTPHSPSSAQSTHHGPRKTSSGSVRQAIANYHASETPAPCPVPEKATGPDLTSRATDTTQLSRTTTTPLHLSMASSLDCQSPYYISSKPGNYPAPGAIATSATQGERGISIPNSPAYAESRSPSQASAPHLPQRPRQLLSDQPQ